MNKKAILVVALLATVAVAGCLNGAGDGSNGDDERTVAVAISADQSSQQEIMEDLNESDQQLLQQAQLGGGNLSEDDQARVEEIQTELEEAQTEALDEAYSEFEDSVDSSETLSIEEDTEVGQERIALVTGSSSEILGLMEDGAVQAIIPSDQYEQILEQQEQQEQQQQQPAPEEMPEDGGTGE
ncbi:MAG: hypothetical protein ACLFMT_05915 [Halobacteriales archaeon]